MAGRYSTELSHFLAEQWWTSFATQSAGESRDKPSTSAYDYERIELFEIAEYFFPFFLYYFIASRREA